VFGTFLSVGEYEITLRRLDQARLKFDAPAKPKFPAPGSDDPK
jgi:hypothetical protein